MATALPLWQLLTVVAVPTIIVLVGIVLNRGDANRLDSKIDRLSERLHSDMMVVSPCGASSRAG